MEWFEYCVQICLDGHGGDRLSVLRHTKCTREQIDTERGRKERREGTQSERERERESERIKQE